MRVYLIDEELMWHLKGPDLEDTASTKRSLFRSEERAEENLWVQNNTHDVTEYHSLQHNLV